MGAYDNDQDAPQAPKRVLWKVGDRAPQDIPDAEYETFLRAIHGHAFRPWMMNGTDFDKDDDDPGPDVDRDT